MFKPETNETVCDICGEEIGDYDVVCNLDKCIADICEECFFETYSSSQLWDIVKEKGLVTQNVVTNT